MFACQFDITTDGILTHSDQSSRFANTDTFDGVFDDGDDFVFRQSAVEKDGATMFGKPLFAYLALEESGIIGSVGIANTDISGSTNAEFGTLFILTAKLVQVVHDCEKWG